MKVNPKRSMRYISRTQPRRRTFDHRSLMDGDLAEAEVRRWVDLVSITDPNPEIIVWDDCLTLGRIVELRRRR